MCEGTIVVNKSDNFRGCGIRLKNCVLTSGLILGTNITFEELYPNAQKWNFIHNVLETSDFKSYDFNIELDLDCLMKKIRKKKFKIVLNDATYLKNNKTSNYYATTDTNTSVFKSIDAYPLGVFKSNLINNYVLNHFSDLNLYNVQRQSHVDSDVVQGLLSVFLLLEFNENAQSQNDPKKVLEHFLNLSHGITNDHRGTNVIIESSPFNLTQFYNSWSKGIISNIVGSKECLFYTDARLVVGCVGAPVFRSVQNKKGELIGMIVNPMLWSEGEWSGFSITVNLNPVLSEILSYTVSIDYYYKWFTKKNYYLKRLIENLDRSVVMVKCGYGMGSGVIVNAKLGVILTCAHCVGYKKGIVRIECRNFKTNAKVIYTNGPDEVFDIAILLTVPLLKLRELPMAVDIPEKGSTVFCVGYPLMDSDKVTLTKGIISNIIPDILLQTTCCIENGNSGGAIVTPSGYLVGIPVNNVTCTTSNTRFPHCNMCIPVSAIADILNDYFATKDVNCFNQFYLDDPIAISEWTIHRKSKL